MWRTGCIRKSPCKKTTAEIPEGIWYESGTASGELPFILSDQGYGIVVAADSPIMCCDIPAYGSYLYAENEEQIDFYFITGKRQNTILNAYAYLCGKL